MYTAANVAKSWIGQPLAEPAAAKLKRKVVAINDADAAGLAEVQVRRRARCAAAPFSC